MFKKIKLSIISFLIILFCTHDFLNAEIIKSIEIKGNERVSKDTILMFSDLSLNKDINSDDLNKSIKELYKTNYFKNISTIFNNNNLIITVEENPIINDVKFNGIKAKKYIKILSENTFLKPRSSFNDFLLNQDKQIILSQLKELGFYFPELDVYVDEIDKNIFNLIYEVNLGPKAKIEKITFNGDKIFKDSKLKNIIVSEEYKPWKFISGKKYLNEKVIEFDKKLLSNFYLNKGFYNVKINASFAKLIKNESFELIFNINANKKFFFDQLSLELPSDFDVSNYEDIIELFNELKGQPYSFNRIEKILNSIDSISTNEQFMSVKSSVEENIIENKISLKFVIEETEKNYVEKINIFNNNITRETVIRNQLELVEGDLYNEILLAKSINNIKSLNFFKNVDKEILDGENPSSKIININVKEKPTGEIVAGAGIGNSGGTISIGVKENNYLGKGIKFESDLTLNDDSIKGLFALTNPNYKNSDKSVSLKVQSSELNKLTDFGYKTNKTGFDVSTRFEYLDDLNLGIGLNAFYENIETDSTASTRQKAQAGNYFDNFINLEIDYDKRNQKYQTTDGFRSYYSIDLPLVSKTNTLTNTYLYNNYAEIFDKNIFKTSFYVKSAFSVTDDDIKLSERLSLPSSKLRGFEYGKIGPKDGNDFIGGNFVSSLNFSSTVPQIFENNQSTDFIIFLDVANVWGVDYDSTLPSSNNIRSSIGIGLDWYSAIGPLNFSLAQPIIKDSTDITESFRFNLGTTF
ncbi:outer membrane protein assembly factor BamA [Candidatus Pelagibacter sp.]|nr:outer membrane protein assembly factor BamA [Candidatus Pelagibacter sp.]